MSQVSQLETTVLKSIDDVPTKCVVHGTYREVWPLIKQGGLNKMNRNHIHFAIGTPEEEAVISGMHPTIFILSSCPLMNWVGMRKTAELLIYIDINGAIADGVQFELSSNKVVLSAGLNGVIAPKHFLCVLDSKTQKPIDPDFPKTFAEGLPWLNK